MNTLFVIAKNTFREIIRDRILYLLFLFTLFLTALSLLLGQLSFAENARIAANYGFTGIQLSMVVLSIFIGSTLVRKELEKKTAFTLLARPVTRLQFLLAKILGFSLAILCLLIGFSLILAFILEFFVKFSFSPSFIIAFWGIFLESFLLICLSVLFSTFSGPMLAPSFTFGVFLIGHWVRDMQYFAEKSKSESFKLFADIFQYIIPDLERFNWRIAPIYSEKISSSEIFYTTAYMVFWALILVFLSGIFLRKKDLA